MHYGNYLAGRTGQEKSIQEESLHGFIMHVSFSLYIDPHYRQDN